MVVVFSSFSDLGAWSAAQLFSIAGYYLTIVFSVFLYFLIDEDES